MAINSEELDSSVLDPRYCSQLPYITAPQFQPCQTQQIEMGADFLNEKLNYIINLHLTQKQSVEKAGNQNQSKPKSVLKTHTNIHMGELILSEGRRMNVATMTDPCSPAFY